MAAVLSDELHVRVFVAQHLQIGRAWNTRDVYSSFWRLYVNDRAGASVQLADGVYALAPRRVHFIPAWVRFTCHNTRTLNHYYAHFDLVGLPAAVVRDVFDRPATLPRNPALESAVRDWMGTLRAKKPELAQLCEVKALIYRSLGALLEGLNPEQHTRCCRRQSTSTRTWKSR
jgi:hypothetical protein